MLEMEDDDARLLLLLQCYRHPEEKQLEEALVSASVKRPMLPKVAMAATATIATPPDSIMRRLQGKTIGGSPNTDSRKVSFGTVHVLLFLPQIGDSPACSSGCPIALGEPIPDNQMYMDVDSYEETRPSHKRRSSRELRIPSQERTKMLLTVGHSKKEIVETARDAFVMGESRRRSSRQKKLDAYYGALVRRIGSRTHVQSI
mmetsp:Transcript_9365/g.15027  ORF Transcript_9365/g.15027 Transcript_9365/m.15027 type:complete len:202 (-) Transcript_9365:763-1368(-)